MTPTPARYTERLDVMVSPEQKDWLADEADRRGISVGQVVRELVDRARGAAR